MQDLLQAQLTRNHVRNDHERGVPRKFLESGRDLSAESLRSCKYTDFPHPVAEITTPHLLLPTHVNTVMDHGRYQKGSLSWLIFPYLPSKRNVELECSSMSLCRIWHRYVKQIGRVGSPWWHHDASKIIGGIKGMLTIIWWAGARFDSFSSLRSRYLRYISAIWETPLRVTAELTEMVHWTERFYVSKKGLST